jgi:hypothetical protein
LSDPPVDGGKRVGLAGQLVVRGFPRWHGLSKK